MKFLAPSVALDPQKPFYWLVVDYLSHCHAITELPSRAFSLRFERMRRESSSDATSDGMSAFIESAAGADPKDRELLRRIITGGRTVVVGQMELASNTSARLKVDVDGLADTILSYPLDTLEHLNEVSAGGLLIIAWEITESFHTTDALWEFLRHCRNASAHGGHFHFFPGEPRRAAGWRGIEVKANMQGHRLVRNTKESGLLQPGDLIYLLADIEAAYPDIK